MKTTWNIIGFVFLLLVIVGVIYCAVTRPFIWQKRDWLNANAGKYFSLASVAGFTDQQVDVAYEVIHDYNGDQTQTSAATQTVYSQMMTAEGALNNPSNG